MQPADSPRAQRILLVSSYGPEHVGGIERVVHNIARIVSSKQGTAVEWCTSNTGLVKKLKGVTYHPMKTWNGLERVLGLPYPLWSVDSFRLLHAAVKRADVVHIHDYIYMGSLAAFVFARWHRKPIVLTQHIGRITFKNPLFTALLAAMNRLVGAYVLSRVNEVVFVAEHLKVYFSSFVRRKMHVVLNGVDDRVFRRDDAHTVSDARAALRLPLDKPLLLFVGRFVEKKGIHVIEHLARTTPHCTWMLVGSGAIQPLKWNLPNVITHAQVPNNDELLAQYYRAADLFVFPAQGEGFPLVLMEALACGLPVMISRKLLIPDPIPVDACVSVEDGGMPSKATPAWETALSESVSPARLQQLRAAVPTSRVPWRWETTVDAYTALYEAVSKA